MNCLDSSALIDYLKEVKAVAEFLKENDELPLFASTIELHEVFVGVARLRGADEVEDAYEDQRLGRTVRPHR